MASDGAQQAAILQKGRWHDGSSESGKAAATAQQGSTAVQQQHRAAASLVAAAEEQQRAAASTEAPAAEVAQKQPVPRVEGSTPARRRRQLVAGLRGARCLVAAGVQGQ